MERKYTNRRYLDALKERILIFDGAMGTSLQNLNLSPAQFGGEARRAPVASRGRPI